MLRYRSALCWFRRDLRAHDHAALHAALAASAEVHCVFVFDTDILDRLPAREDRRVEFIVASIAELDHALKTRGGGLTVLHGSARAEIPRLAVRLNVEAVYAGCDYEPAAVARDAAVASAVEAQGKAFFVVKDHVIFDRDEILAQSTRPYTVFTPYRNAWLKRLGPDALRAHGLEGLPGRLASTVGAVPKLGDLGFKSTDLARLGVEPGMSGARRRFERFLGRLDAYDRQRDALDVEGTSRLSVHLRFGTISIREVVRAAWLRGGPGAAAWLNELAWRDFFFMILHHFPHVAERAFRAECDALEFDNDEARYAAWREGRTGYPLIDAGMRQLNETGYMHNRLRMLTASFLVKDLAVDWRWGERYFAGQLLDFDLAANNGGWQWSASTGCDAQPYFRIFNPVTQSRKFDPAGRFIKRFVRELSGCSYTLIHTPWLMSDKEQEAAGVRLGRDYPRPIVDHDQARRAALARYERIRAGGGKRMR